MKYPSALQHLGESQSHKDPTDSKKQKEKRSKRHTTAGIAGGWPPNY
jgi:hypothetical protein